MSGADQVSGPRGETPGEGPLADVIDPRPVRSHELVHEGIVWSLVRDEVDLGESGVVTRSSSTTRGPSAAWRSTTGSGCC
ncbi:hypothetical protein GCM10025872_19730 [Barrientosiimonas endolithica]|uniref:Uncharacterized protein n=1 Tax=Barrientosiimonas endolithica TaxID=1535208 RepID=A0ABN6YMS4_9MICO|nr:hypothetical protein GCM10025872_19730 [Barrientosiimonas endolithica]